MGALASSELKANFWLLLFGGAIMVYTIWTSKKAKDVIATGVDLSRQSEGTEKFDANNLSRVVVRGVMYIGQMINYVLPKSIQIKIDKRFEKPELKSKKADQAAFDMVRAAVNLMVASILIAIGTSMKLPLSTTYVTFMVAIGTPIKLTKSFPAKASANAKVPITMITLKILTLNEINICESIVQKTKLTIIINI